MRHASSDVLAIDIGGTKMLAARIDSFGAIVHKEQIPTPVSTLADASNLNDGLLALIDSVLDGHRVDAVGIASAGPIDIQAGTISPINIAGWDSFPLAKLIESHLGNVEISLVGDAVASAYGEFVEGAGVGAISMLGIVVSTGIGGGLVLDGRPFMGASANAGHFGHIGIHSDGDRCACGSTGCTETIASGPSMVRHAQRLGWVGDDARQLVADARRGNSVALEAIDRGARALAEAICTTALVVDLDRVVIGGGVSAAGDLLLDPIRSAIEECARVPFVKAVRVVPSALGGDAGIIGVGRIVREPAFAELS